MTWRGPKHQINVHFYRAKRLLKTGVSEFVIKWAQKGIIGDELKIDQKMLISIGEKFTPDQK